MIRLADYLGGGSEQILELGLATTFEPKAASVGLFYFPYEVFGACTVRASKGLQECFWLGVALPRLSLPICTEQPVIVCEERSSNERVVEWFGASAASSVEVSVVKESVYDSTFVGLIFSLHVSLEAAQIGSEFFSRLHY